MTLAETIVAVLGASVLGASAAWWLASRTLSRTFEARLRRMADQHRKQHEAVLDKLNASHVLARKEWERQRQAAPRLAGSVPDARSGMARLEEQLKAAYSELDRLRLEVRGPAPERRPATLANGFADTQPFEPARAARR